MKVILFLILTINILAQDVIIIPPPTLITEEKTTITYSVGSTTQDSFYVSINRRSATIDSITSSNARITFPTNTELLADSNSIFSDTTSVGDWVLTGDGTLTAENDSTLGYSNIPIELNPNQYFDDWDNIQLFVFTGTNTDNIVMKGTGDVTIFWGDDSETTYTLTGSDQNISHTYSVSDTYIVEIDKPNLMTKLYLSSNVGTWDFNTSLLDLTNLTYLRLYNISGTQTINSSDLTNLTYLYLVNISGTQTINSSDLTSLTYLLLDNISGTQTINSSDMQTYYLYLSTITANRSYTTPYTWANNQQYIYMNISNGTGLSSTEVDNMLIDLDNAGGTWAGNKIIDLRGNNAARTSVSDAAVTSLQSKGVTVYAN